MLLQADRFDVVGVAAEGVAALAAIAELRPDVVLLDVQLPDMDGFEIGAADGERRRPRGSSSSRAAAARTSARSWPRAARAGSSRRRSSPARGSRRFSHESRSAPGCGSAGAERLSSARPSECVDGHERLRAAQDPDARARPRYGCSLGERRGRRSARPRVRVIGTPEALALEIADDGIGGADPTRGSGLTGLGDRVDALGGTLEVVSPPGGGARVTAMLPIRSAVPQDAG
jgi:Response regulator receiver domain